MADKVGSKLGIWPAEQQIVRLPGRTELEPAGSERAQMQWAKLAPAAADGSKSEASACKWLVSIKGDLHELEPSAREFKVDYPLCQSSL